MELEWNQGAAGAFPLLNPRFIVGLISAKPLWPGGRFLHVHRYGVHVKGRRFGFSRQRRPDL
jgi:hypothetical protein